MPDLSATPITLFLLILNALVSGYVFFINGDALERLSFRPLQILEGGEYYRLLTAGFVHVGLAHLAFNMWALYLFGPRLELILGPFKFLLLYFGAELAAHGLSLFLHRRNESYAAVGASGAVSGVVFGFCLFYPKSQLGLIFFPVFVDAYIFALLYVAISIFAMRQSQQRGITGGIAHEAHLGGAIGGLLLTILLEPAALQIFLRQVGL